MHEMFMRARWIIAAFVVITIGSIVAYLQQPKLADNSVGALGAPQQEVAGIAEADGAAASGTARVARAEDALIDQTIGEDVRPDEEKEAEAAALAAAIAAAKLPPPAVDEDGDAPLE